MTRSLRRAVVVISTGMIVAGSGGAAFAQAAEQTVSILGLEAASGTPDAVASAVTDSLRQTAGEMAGYRLIPGRDLVEVKLVFSCPDEAPPCMAQAAQSIGVSKLIFGNVEPVGADGYLVTLKLLDAERGVIDTWISEQIARARATSAGLHAPARKWLAALLRQALPGSLKITGGVVGATVWLDGAQAGLLGADGLTIAGVAAGPHQLLVSKNGYEKYERRIELGSAASEKIAVQLTPVGGVPAPRPVAKGPVDLLATPLEEEPPTTAHVGARVTGWAMLGLGLVGIGFGGYASWKVADVNSNLDPYRRYPCLTAKNVIECSADGKINLGAVPPSEKSYISDQESLGNTYTDLQWVGYGIGAAAVVASGVLLYYGYFGKTDAVASRTRPSLIVMPSLGPNSAGGLAALSF